MIQKFIKGVLDDSVESISGMDATFLYSESSNSPMHIATLAIVEGTISYDEFKNGLTDKVNSIPKFKKRLLRVPLNLDYPYWADDPEFDIDIHVQKIALPASQDWQALRELVTSIFSTPLDFRRPLWSVHFIEGLDHLSQLPTGSTAIFTKVHHVMIDGVSGMGILGTLFDGKSDPTRKEPVEVKSVKPIPDDLTLLAKSSLKLIKHPLRLPKAAGKFTAKVLGSKFKEFVEPNNQLANPVSKVPFTIFNKKVASVRTWGTTILDLARVKKLKKIKEVTINDVLVTICAGALRRYLLERQALPQESLVANIPVSTRSAHGDNNASNQIANMFISIATDIEDPLERLELINEQTSINKEKLKTVGANLLADMADAVPFGLANLSARLFSRYQVKEMLRPPFNVTITNVPGPRKPLFIGGKKINNLMGLTPVVDGFGLIIAIFSYDGKLTITATSDVKTMPDADKFARYIRDSANELEELILQQTAADDSESEPFTSIPFFTQLSKKIKSIKKIPATAKGVYHFEIFKDTLKYHYTLTISKSSMKIKNAKPKKSDLHILIKDRHLKAIIDGDLYFDEAVVQGRIILNGSKSKWLPLLKIIQN